MVDPGTASQIAAIHAASQAQAQGQAPGLNPLTGQATQGYQQAQALGAQGMGALSGNAADMQSFMNPYTQSVIDAMNKNWGNLAGQVTSGADAQATAQGAFGGSRSGIAEGSALNQLGQGQMQQIAQLLQQGYGNAQNLASNAANLGLNASGALQNQAEYARQVQLQQQQYALQSLLGGNVGPAGQTSTTQQSSSPWNAILGAGLTAGGLLLGGPAGGAAGAGLADTAGL